jgi:hypothetical protein
MRFAFPKKRKKKLPLLPMLCVFTSLLVIAVIFGEGGVIHALSMRVVKEQTMVTLTEQQTENQQLTYLIRKVQQNPTETQKFLAAYGHIGKKDVVVYNFKSVEGIPSLEVLDQIEDLNWWQRIEIRIRLLWVERTEKKESF